MVEAGEFREDLYYRLNVIPVRVPPLRERRADIPLLAQHFLDRLGRDTPARARVTLAQDAQQAIMAYDWPGNVRQLENVMERTYALSPGRAQLVAADLPEEIGDVRHPVEAETFPLTDEGVRLDDLVADFERTLIRRAIERTGGNKSQAADFLHIKRTTLVEKMKRLERF
jgi:DNA-binding NtrC family response regulator